MFQALTTTPIRFSILWLQKDRLSSQSPDTAHLALSYRATLRRLYPPGVGTMDGLDVARETATENIAMYASMRFLATQRTPASATGRKMETRQGTHIGSGVEKSPRSFLFRRLQLSRPSTAPRCFPEVQYSFYRAGVYQYSIDSADMCTGRTGETATPCIRQHARTYTFLHYIALTTALLSFLVLGIKATPTPVRGGPPFSLHPQVQERHAVTTITTTRLTTRTRTFITTIHLAHTATTRMTPPSSSPASHPMSTSSTGPISQTPSSTRPSTSGQLTTSGPSPSVSSSVVIAKTSTLRSKNRPSDKGLPSPSPVTQRLSRGAIAGITAGSIAAVFGLALVAYEVRRRRMNNARKEELVARPAGMPRRLWLKPCVRCAHARKCLTQTCAVRQVQICRCRLLRSRAPPARQL
ncbi:hypothetical protein LXA43DRAFT_367664 [Ganoderma leucocontextum]|nr:hypothetical protein LXA43DRAFT_367664 [Ganoderma leucocontextum]